MAKQGFGWETLVLGCCGALVLLGGCRAAPETEPAAGVETAAQTPASDSAPGPALPDTAVRPVPQDSVPETFEGTAGIVEESGSSTYPARLQEVRTARHRGFDRVVFEFEQGMLPGYHVEYIDHPIRQCGSGNPLPVAGDGWLRVRFSPAQAHTVVGQPTVEDGNRPLDLPNLKQLVLTCDFEGQVEWVLGLTSPNRYRVLELSAPSRVVVDVRQSDRPLPGKRS